MGAHAGGAVPLSPEPRSRPRPVRDRAASACSPASARRARARCTSSSPRKARRRSPTSSSACTGDAWTIEEAGDRDPGGARAGRDPAGADRARAGREAPVDHGRGCRTVPAAAGHDHRRAAVSGGDDDQAAVGSGSRRSAARGGRRLVLARGRLLRLQIAELQIADCRLQIGLRIEAGCPGMKAACGTAA